MAITRHFYRPHNFAYSKCDGSIGDQDLRIHVLNFQVESRGLAYVREVLDFRGLTEADQLTVQGMIEITDLERNRSRDRNFRLAILTNQPLFKQIARLYGQVIGTPNLITRVFDDDTDEALAWLGYDRKTAAVLHRFMGDRQPVP